MQLTAESSVGEILMHHPKREHFDDIVMNPEKTWFGHAGPWRSVLSAQDRVILRRHIREHFPDVARIWNLHELDFDQLSGLITQQRGIA